MVEKDWNADHWLTAGDRSGVEQLLMSLGWLEPAESVVSAERAGEGNMNLTLRVVTQKGGADPGRSLILKQSRPWVEKYPQISAPVERAEVEAAFYQAVAGIDDVSEMMPTLLGSDAANHCLLLEDLGAGSDLTSLYAGALSDGGAANGSERTEASEIDLTIDEETLESLASYSRLLHEQAGEERATVLANRSMRVLNHEHIFRVPFAAGNGLELDQFEPGLAPLAAELREDDELMGVIELLGQRYLEDGDCLLHGDFFPGSWLMTEADGERDLWVIDPEFAFYGDAEFDVAVALAHLLMAGQGTEVMAQWLDLAFARDAELDASLVAGFAGAEVLRRLMGVAQLPLPPSDGFRTDLVLKAVGAVKSGSIAALLADD